jgi:hypothetical protein
MAKRKEPLLNFTKRNLKIVVSAIDRNLTSDLLPKKWFTLNETNPYFGHCHTASGVIYKVFGSENVHLYRSFDDSLKLVNEPMYHWFILNRHNNEIIDVTSSQYDSHSRLLKQLYKNKVKASILGFTYKTRVNILLMRVMKELRI